MNFRFKRMLLLAPILVGVFLIEEARSLVPVWNGVEVATQDDRVAAFMEIAHTGSSSILLDEAASLATATAVVRDGCFITNGHAINSTLINGEFYVRLNNFAVGEYAAKPIPEILSPPNPNGPYLGPEIVADRNRLKEGLYFPLLDGWVHPEYASNNCEPNMLTDEVNNVEGKECFIHDIAVLYIPPIGFKYDHIDPESGHYTQPTLDRSKPFFHALSHFDIVSQPAGGAFDIFGYGIRNLDVVNKTIMGPTNESPNVDQRTGVERSGIMYFDKYYHCEDAANPSEATCGSKRYEPLFESVISGNQGDSGGPVTKSDQVTGLISHGGVFNGEGDYTALLDLFAEYDTNSGLTEPLFHWPITQAVNLEYGATKEFLTDPTYPDQTEFPGTKGRNLPLVCRPKPPLYFGPGLAAIVTDPATQVETTTYSINPHNHFTGGYVTVYNEDDMNEYNVLSSWCGSKTQGAFPEIEDCRLHGPLEDLTTKNGPIINLELVAKPWPNTTFVFDKWVATNGKKCRCTEDATNPICEMTNEEVLADIPETLIPHLSQECAALFKDPNATSGGSTSGGGPS